jgi:hypothetical protein
LLSLSADISSHQFDDPVIFLVEAKERSGSGDSSGEEDSDEEDEANRSQQDSSSHDEVSFSIGLFFA